MIQWGGLQRPCSMGSGSVLSFGYWTTDFLVVQRSRRWPGSTSWRVWRAFSDGLHLSLLELLALAVCRFICCRKKASPSPPRTARLRQLLPADASTLLSPWLMAQHHCADRRFHVGASQATWCRSQRLIDLRHYGVSLKQEPATRVASRWRWCTLIGVCVSVGTAYLVPTFHQHHRTMQSDRLLHHPVRSS